MKRKLKAVLSVVWLFFSVFVITFSAMYLIHYYKSSHNSEKDFKELKDAIKVDMDDIDIKIHRKAPDFSEAIATNDDFVGWINIPDTNIDYPVVKAPREDEDFYLENNLNKQYNFSGVPYCSSATDIERPSHNITIQSHNIKTGTMFHDLTQYSDEDFYKNHSVFYFDTIYRTGTYDIIAVVKTSANEGNYPYWSVDTCTKDTFNEYVDWLKENSIYDIDEIDDVEYGDRLVTLSTCAYHTDNGRIIVVGKLVETDDENLIQ